MPSRISYGALRMADTASANITICEYRHSVGKLDRALCKLESLMKAINVCYRETREIK